MRLIIGPCILVLWCATLFGGNGDQWPKRVLITNDNGIEDIKIIALARGFARVCETWVVAPNQDRSGTSHFLTIIERGKLTLEKRDLGEGIRAYSLDGYPADCVVAALAALMVENPPDLVVSGINGGPNLGMDWLYSGTIGAARIAAFAGLPAIAVSGLDDDDARAVEAAVDWVVRLAQSELVSRLDSGGYLTVSLPRLPPDQIKGIRWARRAGPSRLPMFELAESPVPGHTVLELTGMKEIRGELTAESDVLLYEQGYIVVVPMVADEHAPEGTRDAWKLPAFPQWRVSSSAGRAARDQ